MARQTSHVIVQKPAPARKKPAKPRDPVASGERDAAHNRTASHNYFLLEKFEAGVSLRGTEVKSIREGKANLKDSYGLIQNGEAFLLNLHIGPYSHGNMANHDATRTRKLLLHRERFASYSPRRRSRATRSSPPGFTSATAGSSANWPWPRASRTGTSARPKSAARPTARPAPPSTPANTRWGARRNAGSMMKSLISMVIDHERQTR
jgi:hypothetical protein